MRKRILSFILAALMLYSLAPFSLADGGKTVTLKNVPDVMAYVGPQLEGPIFITKAVLDRNGTTDDIYLVLLAGVKSPIVNPNNIASCLLSGFSLPNRYLITVEKLCREHIPKGSKVVFCAHSLGGMVAQLFAADPAMKSRYEILNITALGSPLVYTLGREGELHRLADTADPIPNLSITGIHNYTYAISYETHGYFPFSVDAHTGSYWFADTWGEYDCFGVKGGNAKITFDSDDMFCYPYSDKSLIFI